jgi:hypothetical protein
MSVDKLRVFHEEILQEEGVKVSELPSEIQKRIRGFNLLKNKLKNNPDDENLLRQLKRLSVKLGDDVQDFIENDYEEEDDKDDKEDKDDNDDKSVNDNKKEDKKPASPKKEENKSVSPKKEVDEIDKTQKSKSVLGGKFGNSMMEKKIMSIVDSRGDNRIRIIDLEAIIGKEPDYPEQEVNNIKLRKVFLSNDYRLV